MPLVPRDWFDIPDEAVAVGGLPAAQTIEALRNNTVAAFQGADGAPRLYGKAVVPRSQQLELPVLTGLTASAAFLVDDLNYSGSFGPPFQNQFAGAISPPFVFKSSSDVLTNVLLSGTVRFSVNTSGPSSGTLHFRKNGVTVASWAVTNSTIIRTADVAVSAGDQFQYVIAGGGAYIQNMIIYASDAYIRLGVPIRGSDL